MFRDHREGKDEEDEQELQVRRRWWQQRKDGQEQKKRQLLVKPERTDEQRETVGSFSEVRQVRSQNRLCWVSFSAQESAIANKFRLSVTDVHSRVKQN